MDPAPPAVAHIHNHGSVGLKADVADGPGERGRGRAAALLLLPVRHQLQHRKVIAAVDGVVPAHRGCLLQGGRARYSIIGDHREFRGNRGERNDCTLVHGTSCPALKSLCGGGVPSSHPSLGLSVFFLSSCPAPLRVAMRSPLPFPCVPDRSSLQDPARAGGDPD